MGKESWFTPKSPWLNQKGIGQSWVTQKQIIGKVSRTKGKSGWMGKTILKLEALMKC